MLEDEVQKRTIELENKNKILTDYAHMNAHNLRSPLANILGLVNLVETSDDPNDQIEIIPRLKIAADELNNVVIDIRKTLEQDDKNLSEEENK